MSFWYLQISQKNNGIFSKISALASKKLSSHKNKGTLYPYSLLSIKSTGLLNYTQYRNIRNHSMATANLKKSEDFVDLKFFKI